MQDWPSKNDKPEDWTNWVYHSGCCYGLLMRPEIRAWLLRPTSGLKDEDVDRLKAALKTVAESFYRDP